jgi:hypothetical protein
MLGVYVPTPAGAVEASNWTGAYVGIHGGLGWLDYHQTTTPSFNTCSGSGTSDICGIRTSGGMFGGFAGYNMQYG